MDNRNHKIKEMINQKRAKRSEINLSLSDYSCVATYSTRMEDRIFSSDCLKPIANLAANSVDTTSDQQVRLAVISDSRLSISNTTEY